MENTIAPVPHVSHPPESSRLPPRGLLIPGKTCWKVAHARRAQVLIDAATYFGVLRGVLSQARRSIWIAGWDVDGRVPLHGADAPQDGAPKALRPFLDHVSAHRPDLDIRILLWDYAPLYLFQRELTPTINLGWRSAGNIDFRLDDTAPLGGSHHQKIVVVDETLAFCGGIDLALARWDTPEHKADNPLRVLPDGSSYPPIHDVQVMVDSEAAAALAELYRDRWRRATGREIPDLTGEDAPWPEDQTVDFENIGFGLCRTLSSASADGEGVREIEESHVQAIGTATEFIYIENQYLTAHAIRKALMDRLQSCPGLEVIVVGPKETNGWLEEAAMGNGRAVFMRELRGIAPDRVALFHPYVVDGDGAETPIMVHAKVTIVDDRVLRIGSANLNNRSMGFDTECDLVFEAADENERRNVIGIRDRLLSHHLGLEPEEVSRRRAQAGGWIEMVRALEPAKRGLREIPPCTPDLAPEVLEALLQSADPEEATDFHRAFSPPEFDIADWKDERSSGSRLALWTGGIGLVLLVSAAVATGAIVDIDVESAQSVVRRVRDMPWTPPLMMGLYLVLGTIGIPITVMIVATASIFGTVTGFLYAMTGCLVSALAGFAIGRGLGRGILSRLSKGRVERARKALERRGFLSIAGVRLLPVAPFAVINIVAGAARLRLSDFLLGTLFGMLPGIAVVCSIGSGIVEIFRDPSPQNVAVLVAGLALWSFLAFGLRFAIVRLRGKI